MEKRITMAEVWAFVDSELGRVVIGAFIGALLGAIASSVGWLFKLRAERKRDRLAFVRDRSEARQKGYDKFLAAANALQYMKATAYLDTDDTTHDFEKLGVRSLALGEDAAREIRSNMRETTPFDKVTDYFNWLLLADHPSMHSPGVEEFDKLVDLLIKCERVIVENEKAVVLNVPHSLSEDHEYRALFEAASQRFVSTDGTTVLAFEEGEAMAEWIENLPAERESWKTSRDVCWLQMERSGLFGNDLPTRPL